MSRTDHARPVDLDDVGTDRSITLPQEPRRSPWRTALSWFLTIAVALAVTFVVKTWLLQVYSIPSGSMLPTLEVGDRVVVSKLEKDPSRGDIIVFDRPEGAPAEPGAPEVLIKRVIGLPGERVSTREGRVLIDGKALDESYLPDGTSTRILCKPAWESCTEGDAGIEGNELLVPEDSYLVMGDNRNNSADGREFGPVEKSSIVGRAFVRVWPFGRLGGL